MLPRVLLFILLNVFLSLFSPSIASTAEIERLADDDWIHLQSPNFDIVTDLSEEKARHLIEDLEAYRFFTLQILKLNVVENIKPLRILAIGNNANFRKLGLPDNWAGLFSISLMGYAAIANVNGYTTNSNESTFGRQVLFHEYNHFLVRFTNETKIFPKWYDEGYAEYWGTFKFTSDKVSFGSAGSIKFRAGDLFSKSGNLKIDTEKLLKTTAYPEGREALGNFYAQSFFLVHYLNSVPEMKVKLQQYLHYLNIGYTDDQAFNKSFKLTYVELNKLVERYVGTSLKMLVLNTKEGTFNFPKPAIALTTLDKTSFYKFTSEVLPLFSSFSEETIRSVLLKTEELSPDFIQAKSMILIRNYAVDAQKTMAELERLAPNDSFFLTYKANSLLNYGKLLHAAGVESWLTTTKQARSLYRKAIKSNNNLGAAFFGLGEAYAYLPESEPLHEGIVGLETASLFDRSEATFIKLVKLYVRQNNHVGALVAARNAVSFSKDKASSPLILLLDNVELLDTLNAEKFDVVEGGLTFKDGSVFAGSVENGKPNGVGRITRPNGSYYEGNFTNGLMHGQGKLVSSYGYTYDGNFQNGIARGKTKISYPSGQETKTYEGENEYAYPHGKGTLITKMGTYEGDFWYGQQQGKGTFTTADNKRNIIGNWFEGGYEWPEVGGVQFVGPINANGLREGSGVCRTVSTRIIDWCTFKEDVQQGATK